MSWEIVEDWPSYGQGAVYRGAAEIIVAERSGLTPIERLLLWWHSTEDLPFKDVAKEVIVTANYVYVRKQDGTQERVRRDLVASGRVEGRRRQYAVPNGADMVLSDRGGDDVERALMDEGEASGWTSGTAWVQTFAVLAAMVGVAVVLSTEFLDWGAHEIGHGRYTGQAAVGFYACIAAWSTIVVGTFLFPRRFIVDGIGLRTIRGFFRGVRSTVPIEDIRHVEVRHVRVRQKGAELHTYPVFVHTTKKRPTKLREFKQYTRNQAIDFGQLCATTWDVELKSPERVKTWEELLRGH